VFVRALGDGAESVLVLHGQLFDGRVMLPIAEALAARGKRALVPDLPGYGQTPLGEGNPLEQAREALLELVAREELSSLSVVGLSLGTFHATRLALELGPRVKRLALIGALAGLPEEARAGLAGFGDAIDQRAMSPAEMDALVIQRMFSPAFAAASPEICKSLLALFAELDLSALAGELHALGHLPDLRPQISGLSAALSLFCGALDVATPIELSRELAQLAPRAKLRELPGVGHLCFVEKPALVAEIADAI